VRSSRGDGLFCGPEFRFEHIVLHLENRGQPQSFSCSGQFDALSFSHDHGIFGALQRDHGILVPFDTTFFPRDYHVVVIFDLS